MAKRKTQPKRRQTRKQKTNNRKTKNESTWKSKVLSITFSSILITIALGFIKYDIVNLYSNFNCREIATGDYGMQIVNQAINLQHTIRENPNNKTKLEDLLTDRVIWFRRSKKSTSKYKIRTYSLYDKFCFFEYPSYSYQNTMTNDYQFTFVGFHRLREPDSTYVKAENYYVDVDKGKIKEIYSVPISGIDVEFPQKTRQVA